jgi:hypothetical protein
MATAEDVQRAIAASFPEGERAAASDALARLDSGMLEGPRVQLAILALAQLFEAEQRLAVVEQFVRDANSDFRNVLSAAEYPHNVGARQTRPEMAEAYRRLGASVPSSLRR